MQKLLLVAIIFFCSPYSYMKSARTQDNHFFVVGKQQKNPFYASAYLGTIFEPNQYEGFDPKEGVDSALKTAKLVRYAFCERSNYRHNPDLCKERTQFLDQFKRFVRQWKQKYKKYK